MTQRICKQCTTEHYTMGVKYYNHSSILSSLTQICVREEGRVGDGGGTKYDQIRALYILPHLLM